MLFAILLISPDWRSLLFGYPMTGKELKCSLSYVSCFSHVMCFVLVLTSTTRGCWFPIHLAILVFVDSLYILLDPVCMSCRHIVYFFIFYYLFIVFFLIS